MTNEQENPVEERVSADDAVDAQLLARIVDGDRDALAELYKRYHGRLLRFAQRLTGDVEIAHETVNDVMFVVWNKAGTFAGRSRVSTWIMGIAYRRSMKLKTRLQRWTVRFKAADWSEVIEHSAGAEAPMKAVMDDDLVYRAMQLLPPKQRAVMELTYVFGYSYEEIGQIVDCPTNTVKTRMFHARAKLRELLPELEQDRRSRP